MNFKICLSSKNNEPTPPNPSISEGLTNGLVYIKGMEKDFLPILNDLGVWNTR